MSGSINTPLVSCIMPTYNRREFVPHAIRYFLRQTYDNRELIIIDDGQDDVHDLVPEQPNIRYFRLPEKITLGAKLNLGCSYASGNIIANWDDDDWYADWRLQYQIETLLESGRFLCGINKLLYFDLDKKNAFEYIYPPNHRVWLLGSSLCFTRELWKKNNFANIEVGMDGLFVWNTPVDKVAVLSDHRFSVHMIHKNNVSPKNTAGSWWHPYPAEEIKTLMSDDWQFYANGRITFPLSNASHAVVAKQKKDTSSINNVYACLVHEQPECIADLVGNLHYNDPSSKILLYNGSNNPELIPRSLNLERHNAIVYPSPSQIAHGFLHTFALQCMQFSLEHLNAGILTIVDSDQLLIRRNYSGFMANFFSHTAKTGMLSSNPQRIEREDTRNTIALQAFREHELWKPLLRQFPSGEGHFVHWTFWPSTVFTKDAMRDLLQLYKTNEALHEIMGKTRIWATEEVILPTLVKLLGYDILANPCSYDFVRYRQPLQQTELKKATEKRDVFWVHPVLRAKNDAIRKLIRQQANGYITNSSSDEAEVLISRNNLSRFLNKIQGIQGWLTDEEAALLVNCTLQVLSRLPSPHGVVEVGSYHGKSTVLLGAVVKELFPRTKITSIDPHDGKLGAVDQGLKKYPPSFSTLRKNINEAQLEDVIEVIQDRSFNVIWERPVSILFIDGLHDYESVRADYQHFERWVVPGGRVAFHDYADYFPGVKKLVHELLKTGDYERVNQAGSLVILRKL